jgi:hypothetical protein
VGVLGALSESQRKTLANWAEVVAYDKCEMAVQQGDRGEGLYLILRRSAEVRRGNRGLARRERKKVGHPAGTELGVRRPSRNAEYPSRSSRPCPERLNAIIHGSSARFASGARSIAARMACADSGVILLFPALPR